MMTTKRMLAVGGIFLVAGAGWWLLGAATALRSNDRADKLGGQVERLWGVPLVQTAPAFSIQVPGSEQVRWMLPAASEIELGLDTDYRKKGLVWYPTYVVGFDGTYTVTNPEEIAQKIKLHFDFPSPIGTYDGFELAVDGHVQVIPVNVEEGVREWIELDPGASRTIRLSYQTRGIREWRYRLHREAGQVRHFSLAVATNFDQVDYVDGGLSPNTSEATGSGRRMTWKADDLITRQDIGIVVPNKLNPGPVTTRITFFAPVCLLFFFLLVGTINILYKVEIHPMHYLFVAAGFFAFHLLLSYLVGVWNIHVSFVLCAVVSVVLVTLYMRAALGAAFPWKVAVAGQLFYLVLFSYSFFLKGMTGLIVAIGSVVTLAVMMYVTASLNWSEVFQAKSSRKTAPVPEPPAVGKAV